MPENTKLSNLRSKTGHTISLITSRALKYGSKIILLFLPGMAYGGYSIAKLAVDATAVVKLLVGMAWRTLVLNAADAADAHNEDDKHEHKSHTQSANDDVEGVAGHVC